MINFEEELEKFQPSMEIEEVEENVQSSDLTDVSDILKQVLNK
ncbi:MAG: hypothetical protein PUB10_00405 [Clostridiales bacterium]|nr:hypothetical protein [Clostridiales bacterium]